MRVNRKTIVSISIAAIVIVSTFTVVFVVFEPRTKHEPILIWNDEDFLNYDFKGDGTIEKPFLIQNYRIEHGTDGIQISNTTKYFVIRNCYIDVARYGIFIEDAAPKTVRIEDNVCVNSETGIYVFDAQESTVTGNKANNNIHEYGIFIHTSPDSLISNNICNDNNKHGIYILDSHSTTVSDNICNNNLETGILLSTSPTSSLTGNSLASNVLSGIFILNSHHSFLSDNYLYDNEFTFEKHPTGQIFYLDSLNPYPLNYYLSMTLENNYVNGQPLGFYKNLVNETITSSNDNQMIFVNCTNLRILNLDFSDRFGLNLYYCNNTEISNSNFSSQPRHGLTLFYANNTSINSNSLTNNGRYIKPGDGIFIFNSYNSVITNNLCSDNWGAGIGVIDSLNISVQNNTCNTNLLLGITATYSYFINITNNSLTNNSNYGLAIANSDYLNISNNTITNSWEGIFVQRALFMNMTFNRISGGFYGIHFQFMGGYEPSSNVSIIFNRISDSFSYGLAIFMGRFITTYYNSFINNKREISQALDSGSNNTWFNSLLMIGNYWSDYSGVGNYTIAGMANNEDIYPLLVDPLD